ncbi:MAG: hypothetical protein QOD28_3665 [Acidobacteriota bacterium]|nr:hypothetical protein [Acidobacteriota bacterium]
MRHGRSVQRGVRPSPRLPLLLVLALCGAWWAAAPAAVVVYAQSDELADAERLNAELVKLYGAGHYDEAIRLAERVLEIREKALDAAHPAVALSLNNLALLYSTKGDYARAEPLYKRALAIYEKAFGAEHPDVALSLNNLAGLYDNMGDYARAEPLYRRALDIKEKALGAEHPDVALSLNNLAALYKTTGDYARAEPLYLRALAIREKALSAEHPDVALSLNNLAVLYEAEGDYARAAPLFQRALAIYEKTLGAEHPDVALALNNLALLYEATGDYPRVEPLLQRALAIREKALGAEHADVAQSLGNLAELYRLKGDYARSEPLHRRSLAAYEKSLGAEHPDVATALNNLALLYKTTGDYARAEPLDRRALAIREKTLGAEHRDVAQSLNNLGALYKTMGDYTRAAPLYRRALAIREKVLGAEHPDVATSLNNLGVLYEATGDYARAAPLYLRALAVREKALGAGHPEVAQSLNNLALLYEATGDYERAVTGLTRAAEISEHNVALILVTSSERQKQLYLDTIVGETDSIISLNVTDAPKSDAATRLALTTILRRKGRALDAMTDQIAALRRRAAPEDQKLLDQLAAARAQLANVQLGGANGNLAPAARQAQLAVLGEEIERLETDISRRSAEFRAQAQPVTLQNVQAALPADAALIEIFSYQPFNARAKNNAARFGASRYVAYVARREGEPQFVDLGEAAAIESNVEKLRVALRDGRRAAAGDVALVKSAARVVDEQVMRPVRALLGATRRVFLSPDGVLNLIPFAALVDERGKYLVEDYTLTYLTSGRDLLRLQATGESRQPPLVLANPLYDGGVGDKKTETLAAAAQRDVDFDAIDFSKVRYAPLPGTAEEAKSLSALMPGARVLSSAAATESALKQAHSPRLLHVATHGFFLTDQPGAAQSRGLELGGATGDAAARGKNLLLRSGLILAGVNQRQSGTGEDGVLTAAEAAALDLWGTKLVVLSACETGLGDVKNGDGVYGLRRALVLAGSESQVMSLWQVSDAATRDLMKAYYTRLQRGEGRTEALRQVQLEMSNEAAGAAALRGGGQRGLSGSPVVKAGAGNYSHPYYWASFIQSGAWSGVENNPADVKVSVKAK